VASQSVDQGGFADVGAAGKGNLRAEGGGELVEALGGVEEAAGLGEQEAARF